LPPPPEPGPLNAIYITGGNREAEIMVRNVGHYASALIAALILAAGLVSCGNDFAGDGIFSYTAPPSSLDIVSLIPVPIRWEYFVNHEFKKAEDLSVAAVYFNGETKPVSVDEVDISIVEGEEVIHLDSDVYMFRETGEKIINLVYAKHKTGYAVWVRSPAGEEVPSVPSTGDTEIIINVIE
jgi:hypothetical protein